VRDGDDHVLAGDQILVLDIAFGVEDLRAARRRVKPLHLEHLVLDDAEKFFARTEDFEIFGDLRA